jgi:hypothetical protein
MGTKEDVPILTDVEDFVSEKRLKQKRSNTRNAAIASLFCLLGYGVYILSKHNCVHIPQWLRSKQSGEPGSITWIPCPTPREGIDCGVIRYVLSSPFSPHSYTKFLRAACQKIILTPMRELLTSRLRESMQ